MPNITQKFGPKVGAVLGHVLLWRMFDVEQSTVVPEFMTTRVKKLLKHVKNNKLVDGKNPIVKIPLYVSGDLNGNLILTVLDNDNLSIDSNETEGHRAERLCRLFSEENVKQRSVINRRNSEQNDCLPSTVATLQRKVHDMEGKFVQNLR